MQSRTLPLLIVALMCGLGAAYLAWYYAGGANKNDPMVDVYVPVRDIKGLSRLNDEALFKKTQVKQSILRQGDEVVKSYDDVKDMRAKDFILAKDKPFYKSDIIKFRDARLDARLDPDEVAMALRVTPDEAVAGFLDVGDRVDILCKVPSPNNRTGGKFKVTYQNIEVLGVNQQANPNQTGEAQPPQILTLRMKRDWAPAMMYYRQMGAVNVVKRKAGVNDAFSVPEVVVFDGPSGANTDEEGLTPPGTAATPDVPAINNNLPPIPAATQPAPAATQPIAVPPPAETKPFAEPPPPPKKIKHKTDVVEGERKRSQTFDVDNPEYKGGDVKDGKVEEKPKG